MSGLIVFNAGWLSNQGNTQVPAKPFPTGMSFDVDNLVEVLVAAGAKDTRIGGAVGTAPVVFDLGTPFARCVMEGKGLLQLPAQRPANGAYWDEFDRRGAAVKVHTGTHLQVKEGMHISGSCTDPHLTVLVYGSDGRQIGTNIHVCAEPDGNRWKFTRVHG